MGFIFGQVFFDLFYFYLCVCVYIYIYIFFNVVQALQDSRLSYNYISTMCDTKLCFFIFSIHGQKKQTTKTNIRDSVYQKKTIRDSAKKKNTNIRD